MKNRLCIVFIWCKLLFFLTPAFALDYYVAPSALGSGNGSDKDNAANFSSLQTYLSNFSRTISNELNIYFLGGTYSAPNSVINVGNSSAGNNAGLTINFLPHSDEEVIIKRNSAGASFFNLRPGNSSGYMTLNISDIIFSDITITGNYRMFVFNSYTNLSFNNVTFKNNQIASNFLVYGESNTHYSVSFKNTNFESNNVASIIYNYTAYTQDGLVLFENCNFSNNTASGEGLLRFYAYTAGARAEIRNCIFYKNNLTATGADRGIIRSYHSGLQVSGCTFYENIFGSSTNNKIIHSYPYVAGHTNLIYNNTFSNNGVSTAIYVGSNTGTGGIFNNTLYNSGGISLGVASSVRNNLIVGNYAISGTTTNVARNIFSNGFYESGVSNPESIPNLSTYVGALEEYEPGKPRVHPLIISPSVINPLFRKGGTLSELGEYGSLLRYDQRGVERPGRISMGSWDAPILTYTNGRYTIYYDSIAGFDTYLLDLSDYIISLPTNVTFDDLEYTVIQQPDNGLVTPVNSRHIQFIPSTNGDGEPEQGIIGSSSDMIYRVNCTADGVTYTAEIKITFIIRKFHLPLGIIDESVIRCYREMGEVQFESRYKFVSSAFTGYSYPDGVSSFPNGAAANASNNFKYNGFSIPLVGDLDGDGKPEIVALGMTSGRTGLDQYGDYLCILNGQSGKEIVRYQLPFTNWNLYPTGYHCSPSSIAIVDADRNGRAEIIVAVGSAGNANYNYRLLCYEVNENTFSDRENGSNAGNSNKLTLKWQSTSFLTSDANWATKAIPQIVDIDGDGVPEILVCHKIYSALDGTELLTLDENYIGRDPNSAHGDQYIPFAYIYDVDMDGKFDIAAGGKLYYDIDIHKKGSAPYFKTKVMDGIGDGHTAVADINADGIPDIIVSRNRNVNNHNLYVWDPGFFEKDGDIIKRVDNSPSIMAFRETYQGNRDTGSHSYIYVGDIDGREDSFGNKLPEISILGGSWFSTTTPVPVHPNVSGLNPFPVNGSGYLSYAGSNYPTGYGALISYTWDEKETDINKKLKISFILKHSDSSINTGFTLFDFNNDGIQQICYRDEHRLRIISANAPYYDALYNGDMSTTVYSRTGFEYPVIADIDGDGSADMIVMGQNLGPSSAPSFIYAVESTKGDFAPAPMVWNQFMYDPLKINEDLTTPYVNLHPLSDKLAYVLEKDASTSKKTYIYNNTISQAVVSADFNSVLKPIVRIPDAGIEGRIDTQNSRIVMYITNSGDATLNAQTPLRFYLEELGAANIQTSLGGGNAISVIGRDVFPGDTLMITQALLPDELYENYIIRVNDSSTSTNYYEDISKQEDYFDCNWANNTIEVGTFVARNDAATVAQFGEVIIDVLANDVLPEDFDGILKETMFVEYPSSGTWSIANNKLRYTAPGSALGEVIKFRYALQQDTKIKYADVYIYILESCTYGFAVCAGSNYQVCLKEAPQGIRFEWYEDGDAMNYLGDVAPSMTNLTSDQTFYVKPVFGDVTDINYEKHRTMDFPLGKLVISVLPNQPGMLTAKWTGQVDTNWYNPANWVQVLDDGRNIPVTWTPTNCTHVIISKNANHYPILTNPAECANITMEDRAMLAGIHHLTYADASVELKLTATEKDRFVMWSAPLKNMYTGDYHFKKSGSSTPNWGDVYMNYFQAQNPDFSSSVAKENVFTATFGTLNSPLTINQPFAIKVINLDSDATFTFPQIVPSYTDANGKPYPTERDGTGSKFIVDGLMDTNGSFNMPVNDRKSYRMIHVANPFMAYLDVQKFVEANAGKIENSYKLWKGEIDDNFITYVKANERDPYNHFVTDGSKLENLQGGLIAPLQSFFVMKTPSVDSIGTLRISAEMTTTINSDEDIYQLKSGENREWYIMRITAEQEGFSNSTVLHYAPEAVQAYLPEEDSKKLFNTQSPLAVYTLTPSMDALAVYSSGDFSQDVKLGLRLKKAGKVTLNFSGMKYFQHEVYLIDHEKDGKVYDLSITPELTFEMDDYSTGNYIEVNNRFSLNFNYAPTGTSVVPENGITVTSRGGFLYIDANGREINRLQVYNLWGQLVSAPAKKDTYYKIPVHPNQFYLVKGELEGRVNITKVIAR